VERPCVLVVDDEPLVRRALRREHGARYLVLEAGGPAEALAALVKHRTGPNGIRLTAS
jgi:CheY-like chemotaxis protein